MYFGIGDILGPNFLEVKEESDLSIGKKILNFPASSPRLWARNKRKSDFIGTLEMTTYCFKIKKSGSNNPGKSQCNLIPFGKGVCYLQFFQTVFSLVLAFWLGKI